MTTKTNRKIKATDDHLFYTVLGWQPLKSFKLGDRIGLAKVLPITHHSNISDAQIKLTAYLIGDGHLSTKSPACSYFCNSDTSLIADFNRCALELFGCEAPVDLQLHPGRKPVIYARIGFVTAFNRWVDSHLKRAHSRDKEIPSWVFSLSRNQLQLFLGTLWSTDGSFDTLIGHTDYTSTSQTLIRQIQHLLLRLGIVALFDVKKIQYQGKPHISYRAQITGREDMLKFCELIAPYLSASKLEKSQACYWQIKDKASNQSKHTIPPEILTLIASVKYGSGMTWEQIDKAAGNVRGTMSSGLNFKKTPTRSLARHRVRNFAKAFQDETLRAIADSEVFWDEIVSIEYAGEEEVFDLTIPGTHNFIANDFIAHNCMGKKKADEMQKQRTMFIDGASKNGIQPVLAEKLFEQMVKFAEYCFNKSHSTAYAYVTYQTAYLKANYPTEYMAALLTANSGDQDKVKKYLTNCANMNIEVQPPDINTSEVEFTALPDNKILFGLSAVKNVGEGAIDNILLARKEGGTFKSLADLCDRVDLRAVNSRALESLIKCGALDKINPNRQQLIADLDLVIKWAQDREKDRASGQGNLFDLLGIKADTNGFESAPKAKETKDFSPKEKLQFEKELLGFYVSEHPLKFANRVAKNLETPITLNQLLEKRGKKVTVIVMLTEVKKISTKKDNRQMAFLQMEDLEGQSEAVVFPDTYEKFKDLLVTDQPLIVLGKVEIKEDKPQIIVDEINPIPEETTTPQRQETEILEAQPLIQQQETTEQTLQMVLLELTPEEVEDAHKMNNLKVIFGDYTSGDSLKVPVVAMVVSGEKRRFIEFGLNYRVQQYDDFVNRLKVMNFNASILPNHRV